MLGSLEAVIMRKTLIVGVCVLLAATVIAASVATTPSDHVFSRVFQLFSQMQVRTFNIKVWVS